MNKNLYKIIFSRVRNAYVVVSEITSSLSGSSCTARRRPVSSSSFAVFFATGLSLSFMLMASAFAAPALPQGGAVAQGNVAVSQSGNVLTVNQSTDKAIVNWQSFSIGTGAAVNIVQPSASSTHLSRVTGNDPSVIQGQLHSNGQVVLVNPNGIVVGKDGSVSASSFTASTLNITDADFMAGKYQYARNGANGEVVNQGKIETKAGGYVALLGAKVTNEGTITSQQGAVYLGAGDAVAVPVTGSGRIKFEVSPAAINTSVSNNKDAVIVAEGGQVYMRAASLNDLAVATVQQSGLVDVSGAQGGNVTVLADKGNIKVDGTIKANSSVAPKGGNIVMGRDLATGVLAAKGDYSGAKLEAGKGFVETSGSWIATTGTRVIASEWLLDPVNIRIVAGAASPTVPNLLNVTPTTDSTILASDISANLNLGTSVNITTGLDGFNGSSDGNITVEASILKSVASANTPTLTLTANNSIELKTLSTIGSTAGALNVVMTANGNSNLASNSRGIILNSVIDANGGTVSLTGHSRSSAGIAAYFVNAQNQKITNFSHTNNTNSGVVFNNNSGIKASSYNVVGTYNGTATFATAHGGAPKQSIGTNGVAFLGNNIQLTSSSDSVTSTVSGKSIDSVGNFGSGVFFSAGSAVNINSGAGQVQFLGEHVASSGPPSVLAGMRLGSFATGPAINITGNVNFKSLNHTDTAGVQSGRLVFRSGTINVNDNATFKMDAPFIEFYDSSANLKAQANTNVELNGANGVSLGPAGTGGEISTKGQLKIASTTGDILVNRDITGTGSSSIAMSAKKIDLTGSTFVRKISAKNIDLISDNINIGLNHSVEGVDKVSIKAFAPTESIKLGISDATPSLPGLSQTEFNRITTAHLMIGDPAMSNNIDFSGDVTVASSIGALTLQTGGSINLNYRNLDISGRKLTLNGNTTQLLPSIGASGSIKSSGLELLGLNAVYNLSNPGNKFTTIAGNVKSATIFHTDSLTVGEVNSSQGLTASGTIKLESNGSIIVKKNITSAANGTSSSAIIDAIVLNAGASQAVNSLGTSTNDNVVMDGGVIGAGLLANARVKIYTGSIVPPPNNIAVVAGNIRYGSDEVTTGYTKALDAGIYAIYRERPTATVTFNNATKTYDGNAFIGHDGITEAGLVNNDTTVGVTISNFIGDAEGKKDVKVGGYTISGTGLSNVGYNLTYVTGKLTINPKSITALLSANNKTYDGNTTATGSFSSNDVVTGETLATNVASLTFDNKNAGTNKLVTATGITLVDNGAFKASNYVLAANTATGSATIDKKTLTLDVSGASILDKTYNANTAASFNVQPSLVGVLIGESVGFSASANFIDPNAGKNKLVTLSNVALLGGDAINYNLITPATTLTGNINKARISVTINNATVNAGGTVPLTYTVNGLVNGQTATSAGISLVNLRADGYSASSSSNTSGTYNILADSLNAQNYELSGLDSIIPGILTVTASAVPTETTDATRRPVVSTTTLAASNAASASAAVNIGGSVQGGEFSLASAEECAASTCHCETSDFDQDVELCYEEDPRPARGTGSRISASL